MSHLDCLIRGDEYLEKHPDFKLTGRTEQLARLHGILMRSRSNNALVVGPGGVGASALCMGLESQKNDPNTPLDIVSKRKFWLDTDALFSSGDTQEINDTFSKLTGRLARTTQAVLIIDDMKDFVEAARNNGATNLINTLMRDIKAKKYQAVIESRDQDLDAVLKCHSDMSEIFTMMDVPEPEGEELESIVRINVARLEKHHGIKIEEEAILSAIEVTSKYRANDASLSRAQPERTLTLIDRALTNYRQIAHARAPELDALESRLMDVKKAKVEDPSASAEVLAMGKDELDALHASLNSDIEEATQAWETQRKTIRDLHKDQLDAEQLIRDKEDEIEDLIEEEKDRREELAKNADADADGQISDVEAGTQSTGSFLDMARSGGFESPAIKELRGQIEKIQEMADASKTEYDVLMEQVNANLLLTRNHVLKKFSDLSGIPAARLDEDEVEKLKSLPQALMSRVYDQDRTMKKLASSVKAARVGLRDPNKPMGSFIFIGPSGTGKTESSKALAHELFGDERALMRLDMSEYQEKHAVARLIGAPPGYEGFEAGGILTNAMRRNPRRVVLFDEVEKGHPDVMDTLLQIVDDARLTDNVGRVCSFADSVVILTSNIGSEYFLDPDLTYDQAVELATKDLEEHFRPEFLNRFNGRRNIEFFQVLSHNAIEKIVTRELKKINRKLAARELSVDMAPSDLKAMVEAVYRPKDGARGAVGFVNDFMDERLSDVILETPNAKGVMQVGFDAEGETLTISPPVANDPGVGAPEGPKTEFDAAVG